MSRQRLQILDLLRGLLFVNMAAYHFLYDWVYIFEQSCPFMDTNLSYLWQQFICSGFILLAGCCCTLSRYPARNGLRIFLCGLIITCVTWIVTPQERVIFGILHFTGLAYLLTAWLQPLLCKLPTLPALLSALLLFAFTKGIHHGYLGFFDIPLWYLPDWLYQHPLLFAIGLPNAAFFSGDYFPLLPWIFLFFTAYWGGPLLLRTNLFRRISHWQLPVLNWTGRNTLLLYMLHQPIIYGILFFIFS